MARKDLIKGVKILEKIWRDLDALSAEHLDKDEVAISHDDVEQILEKINEAINIIYYA